MSTMNTTKTNMNNKPYCITQLDVDNMLEYDTHWINTQWDGSVSALTDAINDGDYRDFKYMLYTASTQTRGMLHKKLGNDFVHFTFNFEGCGRVMVILNEGGYYWAKDGICVICVKGCDKVAQKMGRAVKYYHDIFTEVVNGTMVRHAWPIEKFREDINRRFGHPEPETQEDYEKRIAAAETSVDRLKYLTDAAKTLIDSEVDHAKQSPDLRETLEEAGVTHSDDSPRPYCVTLRDLETMLERDTKLIHELTLNGTNLGPEGRRHVLCGGEILRGGLITCDPHDLVETLKAKMNDYTYNKHPFILYGGDKEQRHALHKLLGNNFMHQSIDFDGYGRVMIIINKGGWIWDHDDLSLCWFAGNSTHFSDYSTDVKYAIKTRKDLTQDQFRQQINKSIGHPEVEVHRTDEPSVSQQESLFSEDEMDESKPTESQRSEGSFPTLDNYLKIATLVVTGQIVEAIKIAHASGIDPRKDCLEGRLMQGDIQKAVNMAVSRLETANDIALRDHRIV